MQPVNEDCVGVTWFIGIGSLGYRASSLRIMLANLASVAMDVSIEWRPLFDEVGLLFLDLSGFGFHWMVFSAKSSYIFHHSCSSLFQKFPLIHDF